MRTVRSSSRLLGGGLHIPRTRPPPEPDPPPEQAPPGTNQPPPGAGTPQDQTPRKQATPQGQAHPPRCEQNRKKCDNGEASFESTETKRVFL